MGAVLRSARGARGVQGEGLVEQVVFLTRPAKKLPHRVAACSLCVMGYDEMGHTC